MSAAELHQPRLQANVQVGAAQTVKPLTPLQAKEISAVESAYQEHLRTCFHNLVTNLLDNDNLHPVSDWKKNAIEPFRQGVYYGRQAREYALGVLAE